MESGKGTPNVVLTGLAAVLVVLALAPSAMALSKPRDLAGAALHPWRLETRSYAPLWPLRDGALRDRTFSRLQRAGVRYARVDLKWSSVQPYGRLVDDWSEFDATVASARYHHVRLEPVVTFTPSWANGGAGPFAFPTDSADFQSFMQRAMERYRDIEAWEIWNEPNTTRFSPPRPDPAKYVAMLRAASRARFWAKSSAKLITGGVATGPTGEVSRFADQIARLGAFKYADALGVHPYSRQAPDGEGSAFVHLPHGQERVSRAAGRSVDFWVTEYGYPNLRRWSSYGPPADERQQAERLQKAFAMAVGWPWLKRLTWYGLRDDCDDAAHPDCRFGLLRTDFSPKLGWFGLQQVLAGNLPQLDTRTSIRRRSRRKRRRRVQTLLGRVVTPGTDPARGSVVVTATRRYKHHRKRRRIRTTLQHGRYRVSLARLRPGRWRFGARFAGDRRYLPSRSRLLRLRVRKRR